MARGPIVEAPRTTETVVRVAPQLQRALRHPEALGENFLMDPFKTITSLPGVFGRRKPVVVRFYDTLDRSNESIVDDADWHYEKGVRGQALEDVEAELRKEIASPRPRMATMEIRTETDHTFNTLVKIETTEQPTGEAAMTVAIDDARINLTTAGNGTWRVTEQTRHGKRLSDKKTAQFLDKAAQLIAAVEPSLTRDLAQTVSSPEKIEEYLERTDSDEAFFQRRSI
ncbi:MAG: hypothetical protein KGJ07_02040 [Patescibacteria group bacterium]|nr:hypothetical protein [Patescibacteria group bacterium]MDE2589390.1 hypothetical protein [Patescibacteria group bacterium]